MPQCCVILPQRVLDFAVTAWSFNRAFTYCYIDSTPISCRQFCYIWLNWQHFSLHWQHSYMASGFVCFCSHVLHYHLGLPHFSWAGCVMSTSCTPWRFACDCVIHWIPIFFSRCHAIQDCSAQCMLRADPDDHWWYTTSRTNCDIVVVILNLTDHVTVSVFPCVCQNQRIKTRINAGILRETLVWKALPDSHW